MNLINNWMQPVTLAAGATSLALDLPDGLYRLSLTDSATAPTRWEIVGAVIEDGQAVLARGLEGTLDQDWPDGSGIYAGITAGMLGELYQRITSLEARVAALEPVLPQLVVDVGKSSASEWFGYYSGLYGGVEPPQLDIPGFGLAEVKAVLFVQEGDFKTFGLSVIGEVPSGVTLGVDVEGYGVLTAEAGTFTYYPDDNLSEWYWPVSFAQAPWQLGEERRVTLSFN